jgi:opacity protein-like surface antigen
VPKTIRIGLGLTFGIALMLGVTAPAAADLLFTGFVGQNRSGSGDVMVDSTTQTHETYANSTTYGGALMWLYPNWNLGIEGELTHTSNYFAGARFDGEGLNATAISLVFSPTIPHVRPYVLGGLALAFESGGGVEASGTGTGFNVGGGVMVFPAQRIAIRGDVRYFKYPDSFRITGIGPGNLTHVRLTGGVVIAF